MKKILFLLFGFILNINIIALPVYNLRDSIFIDKGNHRVGIDIPYPQENLHITGNILLENNHKIFLKTTTGNKAIGIEMNTLDVLTCGWNHFNLRFGTNSTERIRLTGNGKVGIGTTIPQNSIHLHNNDSLATLLHITNNTTDKNPSDGITIGLDINENFELRNQENSPIIFYTNNLEKMRILPTGNVGIGITNPSQKLSINGDAVFKNTFASRLYLDDDDLANQVFALKVNGDKFSIQQSDDSFAVIADILQIEQGAGQSLLYLDSTSRVGIGITNPGYKLHVNGTGYYQNELNCGEIKATASSGLKLADDGGNLGVFIKDGGMVGIGTTDFDTALNVSGSITIKTYGSGGNLGVINGFLNSGNLYGFSIGYGYGSPFPLIDTNLDFKLGSPGLLIAHNLDSDSTINKRNYIIFKYPYLGLFDNDLSNITSSENFAVFSNLSIYDEGGLEISGLGINYGLQLTGYGNASTGTDNTKIGVIHLKTAEANNESPTRNGDNDNIITFANYDLTRMILKGDGRLYVDNAVFSSGYDFAEYFESESKVRSGFAIGLNLETGLVREYQKGDVLIGIQSKRPCFVGNYNINKDTVLVGLVGQFEIPKNSKVKNNIVYTEDFDFIIGYKLKGKKIILKISKNNQKPF